MMNSKTRELPQNIQAAMTDYEAKKQAFIVECEKYSTLLTRLNKHKKTAQAALNESEQSGQAWRELLKESEGVLTKELNALRRQEGDSKDLAQEFDKIIAEVEKTATIGELAAYDAWCEYSTARSVLINLQDAYEFEQAKAALLAMPEAKVIARAIIKTKKQSYHKLCEDFGGGHTILEQREYERMATSQANQVLGDMFAALLLNQDSECESVEALVLESHHPIDKKKFSRLSMVRMRDLRKELSMATV